MPQAIRVIDQLQELSDVEGPFDTGQFLQWDGEKFVGAEAGGGTPGGSSGDLQYNNAGSFDGSLLKQDSNKIEQRNGANAQILYVYNTYTNASNYEGMKIGFDGGAARVLYEPLGSGVGNKQVWIGTKGDGVVFLVQNDTSRWEVNAGYFGAASDGAYDLGQAADKRPNIVYVKTSIHCAGTKVIGAQGAAVADATGAGDVVAQLNSLLARLRTHGLIAT